MARLTSDSQAESRDPPTESEGEEDVEELQRESQEHTRLREELFKRQSERVQRRATLKATSIDTQGLTQTQSIGIGRSLEDDDVLDLRALLQYFQNHYPSLRLTGGDLLINNFSEWHDQLKKFNDLSVEAWYHFLRFVVHHANESDVAAVEDYATIESLREAKSTLETPSSEDQSRIKELEQRLVDQGKDTGSAVETKKYQGRLERYKQALKHQVTELEVARAQIATLEDRLARSNVLPETYPPETSSELEDSDDDLNRILRRTRVRATLGGGMSPRIHPRRWDTPGLTPPSRGLSEKIPDPELYAGGPGPELDTFITKLEIKLQGNRDRYHTEEAQLRYAYGRLKDKAAALMSGYFPRR
ncbi:hypothetical protein B0A49_13976, partial [Cryomyces minteri]